MRRRMIKVFSLVLVFALMLTFFAGCSEPKTAKTSLAGMQIGAPKTGEEYAIMHTSMGDLHIRFFPEKAPKAVENFLTHAKNGYYDGLTFHRILENFMVQGGDPDGNGSGGKSIWEKPFEDEFSPDLVNIRGSLAMANSGPSTNGSQFFINQAPAAQFQNKESLIEDSRKAKEEFEKNKKELAKQGAKSLSDVLKVDYTLVPDNVWDLYAEHGGNIHLDGAWHLDGGGHTVFAHVFEGMDVVDNIVKVKTDANGVPDVNVLIESIEVKKYK